MAEFIPYYEKLRDPRWQKRRLEIMQRDRFGCIDCGDSESTLNVHHCYYEKGLDPWEYDDDCLKTLCEHCHERRHSDQLELLQAMSRFTLKQIDCIIGFAKQLDHYQHDAEHELWTDFQKIGAAIDAHDFDQELIRKAVELPFPGGTQKLAAMSREYYDSKKRDHIALHT